MRPVGCGVREEVTVNCDDLEQAGGRPWVTAVITTYERPQLAKRAIRSALAQTYSPLQVVVVEDGSDTGLESWLRSEEPDRVEYSRHEVNRGLAAARNTGLRLAKGEFVAYLDDDDEWKPEKVQRQVDTLNSVPDDERERLGVVYCGVDERAADGTHAMIRRPRNQGSLREAIIRENASTLPSTCLFPKAVLEAVGGFDETIESSIDHDIWMSLADAGYEAKIIDEPLVIGYRADHPKMTTKTAQRIRGVRQYTEKWRPTYQTWFGEREGSRYADRYFVRVIVMLAAAKLMEAKPREAWQCLSGVARYRRQLPFAIYAFTRTTLSLGARRVLPPGVPEAVLGKLKPVRRTSPR